ncbi:hypothetical protein [Schlesneria paludicola]|uniref:hypothetical protein n=1 Tax=Schlesneria paludicola TaxID=360056 RepID=UPI00029B14A8|nr:hypothetical protein [Schlesneria paludicola]
MSSRRPKPPILVILTARFGDMCESAVVVGSCSDRKLLFDLDVIMTAHNSRTYSLLVWFRRSLSILFKRLIGNSTKLSTRSALTDRDRSDPLSESLRRCCEAECWEQKLNYYVLSRKSMYIVELAVHPYSDSNRREAVRSLEHLLRQSELQ